MADEHRYHLVTYGILEPGDEVFEYGDSEGEYYEGWEKVTKSDYGTIIKDNMVVRRVINTKDQYLVNTNHHFNPVDITAALSDIASQENCDGDEYDLMMIAADYIRYLRNL